MLSRYMAHCIARGLNQNREPEPLVPLPLITAFNTMGFKRLTTSKTTYKGKGTCTLI